MLQIEIEDQRISDECPCPEEDLVIGLCFFTIHMEPDDSGHIFLDLGDYTDEKIVDCTGIEDLREKARDWAEELHKKWDLC